MSDVDREVADLKGPAAIPRRNGELVFQRPWEGRAFGMAIALRDSHRFGWGAFRDRLEGEIGAAGPQDDGTRYYERWLAAFEHLLIDEGLISLEELEHRADEYRQGVREEVF
ncbi:MAG TPA: nitrile hydratase accessory protein [Candidatus Dormibacteraeota bacterium]|nr:nitrile hydratase accessory protein [Candidatus Dormibacteraeota bacterium]